MYFGDGIMHFDRNTIQVILCPSQDIITKYMILISLIIGSINLAHLILSCQVSSL